MELAEAIEAAIKSCVQRGILVYFLERYASEVLNMLFTEWNLDDALAVAREEAREETVKSMLEEGLDIALISRITKLPQQEILALR